MPSKEILPNVGYVDTEGDVLSYADFAAEAQDPDMFTDDWDGGRHAEQVIAEKVKPTFDPDAEYPNESKPKTSSLRFPVYDAGIEAHVDGPYPSVSFKDAAVALDALMQYFSRRNQTNGAAQQLEQRGSDFTRRMGGASKAENVVGGMSVKASSAAARNKQALDTLVDGPTLRRLGQSESQVARARASQLEVLNAKYGGAGKARARQQLVKRVQKLI